MKKYAVTILFVLCVLGFFLFNGLSEFSKSKKSLFPTPTASLNTFNNEEAVTAERKVDTITMLLDVLYALDSYNFAILDTSTTEDVTLWLTQLMNAKKRMQRGDFFIQSYVKNPNKYISITARGMITGSAMVQSSTENLIQYLRNVNEDDPSTYSDLQYQGAKYLSDNKEGYVLIAQSAPQVTALLWEPANSENPSGPIPYTVSKADRQLVLDRIDELFSDDLKEYRLSTNNFNSIIFAVKAIKENIEPDTYEQVAKNN